MSTPTRLGLITLLEPGRPLTVPHFQRSYAWDHKQVDEYWNDLKAALDAAHGPADYFMGLVVVDDTRRIQDGQQRLATTPTFVQELYAAAKATRAADVGDTQVEDLFDDVVLAPPNTKATPILEMSADRYAMVTTDSMS